MWCWPSRLPLWVHVQHSVVVTVESAGLQQLSGRSLTRSGNLLCLSVVLFGPFDFLQQVWQVPLHRDVVSASCKTTVEIFIILRVLLQNQTVPEHQVRKPIRCHRSIHVHLVLVLKREEKVQMFKCKSVPYMLLEYKQLVIMRDKNWPKGETAWTTRLFLPRGEKLHIVALSYRIEKVYRRKKGFIYACFPHLKEVKESNKRCLAYVFLPVSEKEPCCDSCIQQLWVFLGQRDQLKTLLSTVPTTEKCPICFVSPRRPWKEAVPMLPKTAGTETIRCPKSSESTNFQQWLHISYITEYSTCTGAWRWAVWGNCMYCKSYIIFATFTSFHLYCKDEPGVREATSPHLFTFSNCHFFSHRSD